MPFYCSNVPSKISTGALEQSFLEVLEQPVKLKILLVIVVVDLTVVKSNVKKKWANEENQIFINKNDSTVPRSFH